MIGRPAWSLFLAILLCDLSVRAQDTTEFRGYAIDGHFDVFSTDEMGKVFALEGDELRLFDTRGRSWLRNSTKTFGRISTIDAFYSLKPMLFAPEQGQIAVLDNTLSLQGSVINLPRNGFPQVVLACMSVQNHFWFFDQQEMALVRVDNQLRKRADTGRLDQLLGFVVEPREMMELDARLYVNDPRQGILVFDLFGTYMRNIPILDAHSMQVTGDLIYYLDATGAHLYDTRSFAIVDLPIDVPVEQVRAMRVAIQRIYLLTGERILVQRLRLTEH